MQRAGWIPYQVDKYPRVAKGTPTAVTGHYTAPHLTHWLLSDEVNGKVLVHLQREGGR